MTDFIVDTRGEAYSAIRTSGRADSLAQRVFEFFADGAIATADEAAAALGEHPLAIRPRVTEIKKFLAKTGEKRLSSGGRMSAVYRIA